MNLRLEPKLSSSRSDVPIDELNLSMEEETFNMKAIPALDLDLLS